MDQPEYSSGATGQSDQVPWPGPASTALTPEAALIERAVLGDAGAAAEAIRRLAAGDAVLARAVSRPDDAAAESMRALLLQFLALGTWQGRALPLAPGYHAGRDGQRLRHTIAGAVDKEPAAAWQTTLLEGLRDPNPAVRQMAALLVSSCSKPAIVAALVALLTDRDEGMRWAAATALTRCDWIAVEAVLRRICGQELVPEIRHVAAYVLRHAGDPAVRQTVAPVVQALDSADYRISAPQAASRALQAFGSA